jgi:multisubunit Na+/H+ antiporter MnhG subunit
MLFFAILIGPVVMALIIRACLGEEYYWMRRRRPDRYP